MPNLARTDCIGVLGLSLRSVAQSGYQTISWVIHLPGARRIGGSVADLEIECSFALIKQGSAASWQCLKNILFETLWARAAGHVWVWVIDEFGSISLVVLGRQELSLLHHHLSFPTCAGHAKTGFHVVWPISLQTFYLSYKRNEAWVEVLTWAPLDRRVLSTHKSGGIFKGLIHSIFPGNTVNDVTLTNPTLSPN